MKARWWTGNHGNGHNHETTISLFFENPREHPMQSLYATVRDDHPGFIDFEPYAACERWFQFWNQSNWSGWTKPSEVTPTQMAEYLGMNGFKLFDLTMMRAIGCGAVEGVEV